MCQLTIPTSSQDMFITFYTHIIQHWKEFLFGLNLEHHRFDAFLRLETTVRLQIEVAGKILGWSFTFGVRSVENCCKKGTLKNLTIPNGQPIFWACFELKENFVERKKFLQEELIKARHKLCGSEKIKIDRLGILKNKWVSFKLV